MKTKDIAEFLAAELVGDPDIEITGIASLEAARTLKEQLDAARAELDALMARRQEAASPEGGAAAGSARTALGLLTFRWGGSTRW